MGITARAEAMLARARGEKSIMESPQLINSAAHYSDASRSVRAQIGEAFIPPHFPIGATENLSEDAIQKGLYNRVINHINTSGFTGPPAPPIVKPPFSLKGAFSDIRTRAQGARAYGGELLRGQGPKVRASISSGWEKAKNFANLSNEDKIAASLGAGRRLGETGVGVMNGMKGAFNAMSEGEWNSLGGRLARNAAIGAGLGAGSSLVGSLAGETVDDRISGHGMVRSAFHGAMMGAAFTSLHAGGSLTKNYIGPGQSALGWAGGVTTKPWVKGVVGGAMGASVVASGIDVGCRRSN